MTTPMHVMCCKWDVFIRNIPSNGNVDHRICVLSNLLDKAELSSK